MRFPPVPQHLLIEWLNGWARVPTGGRPVVRTGVQVSVFSGRLHRIPRTYPRFWAGLRALKLPIYPFFGPAYRPGPPRFIRTAGRPLCVYSGVLSLCAIWNPLYFLRRPCTLYPGSHVAAIYTRLWFWILGRCTGSAQASRYPYARQGAI